MSIPVIYEDENMLVINKPAGLVVAPTETQAEDTLADILTREFKINVDRRGIVHRLDKDTSGLLLVAKSLEVLEKLQAQFKQRIVKKEYIALVHGTVDQEGIIKAPIDRNPGDREKFIVIEGGREAETHYKIENYYDLPKEKFSEVFAGFNKIQMRKLNRNNYGHFTLLRCFPLTGRTHQIRVHLKYIGFPIVGDEKYAGRKTSRLDHRICPRQFLHAARISFIHPEKGEKLQFESSLPEDLIKVLSLLEKKNN